MLICPECAGPLTPPTPAYRCAGCGSTYPVEEGIPSLVPRDGNLSGYDAKLFELIEAVEPRHFWFRARNDLIVWAFRSFLPRGKSGRVLELGCGTGAVLSRLVREGIQAEGADLFREALQRCRSRLSVPLWRVDARRLPFVAEFDAVGLFDCLEHIEDEKAVLSGASRSLRPGGIAVITVPALPGLWSELDVLSHHRRRYTKPSIMDVVRNAGLEIVRASYFNAVLLPALWLQRRVLGRLRPLERERALRVPPRLVNIAVYRLLDVERWFIERQYDLGAGASLLVIARRPSSDD